MRLCALLIGLVTLTGCTIGAFVTPGPPASFFALGLTDGEARALTDEDVRALDDRQPATAFPAAFAITHLQGPGYASHAAHGYGRGPFTLVTAREAEAEADFTRLEHLPGVRAIAALNRMVVPEEITSLKELRYSAATVHADILLLYTFDTRFETNTTVPFLTLLTLGLAPTRNIRNTSTASAALVDVRTGFVYGLAESTHRLSRLAGSWNTSDAMDTGRRDAEARAFTGLVDRLAEVWAGVRKAYDTASPDAPPPHQP